MKRLGAIGIAAAITSFLVPGVAAGEASDTGPDHSAPDHWCPVGESVDYLKPEDTWPFTDCMDEPPTTTPPTTEPPPPEEPPPPPRVKPAPPVPGKPAFTG